MHKYIVSLVLASFICGVSLAQNVGIGTSTPNSKAVLDIKSTDKGILFPRLTTAQRNAITNPPDGLHLYNKDEHCLNYYDSAYKIWNCYCPDCQTVIIHITDDLCNVDFYNQFARYTPAKKYIIDIHEDVYINGCNPGDTALSFINMPPGVSVTINNYGGIYGGGGKGGYGLLYGYSPCPVFNLNPARAGGAAILNKTGVSLTINNYGIVAGGGGGGGGSDNGGTSGYGGGGGGGAGLVFGPGGAGGGYISQNCSQFGCSPCFITNVAQPGETGTNVTGGNGGAGSGGAPAGGNGGGKGQNGQNGSGTTGGAAGKAIGGGTGNTINNLNGGLTFGLVD